MKPKQEVFCTKRTVIEVHPYSCGKAQTYFINSIGIVAVSQRGRATLSGPSNIYLFRHVCTSSAVREDQIGFGHFGIW